MNSISFDTNQATYGPFGYHAPGDTGFDFQIGGHNKFCGFHGTSNLYLHPIGFYMEPMTTLSNVNILQEKANIKNEKASLQECKNSNCSFKTGNFSIFLIEVRKKDMLLLWIREFN